MSVFYFCVESTEQTPKSGIISLILVLKLIILSRLYQVFPVFSSDGVTM